VPCLLDRSAAGSKTDPIEMTVIDRAALRPVRSIWHAVGSTGWETDTDNCSYFWLSALSHSHSAMATTAPLIPGSPTPALTDLRSRQVGGVGGLQGGPQMGGSAEPFVAVPRRPSDERDRRRTSPSAPATPQRAAARPPDSPSQRKLSVGVFGRRSVGPAEGRGSHRLVCLDAARGLTVLVMMFVDETGHRLQGYVNHSAWDGVTLADFVMPFFLFIVGTSVALSFRKFSAPGALVRKVSVRTLKLLAIGLATQGADLWHGGGFNLMHMRLSGILQRIAVAYLLVALMALYLPRLTSRGFQTAARANFGVPPVGPCLSLLLQQSPPPPPRLPSLPPLPPSPPPPAL
jgi:hypothetical protein